MVLPQTNAKLVGVGRGGGTEDYDAPAGAGGAVWTGSTEAYYGRRRANLTEGQMLNRTVVQYVMVPGDVGIDFAPGDVVTLKQRGVSFSRVVREFSDRDLGSTGSQPIRLDLEDQ